MADESMNPSFTRGEYWLLEAVVDGQCPLCFVAGAHVEEMFNKTGHGLDRARWWTPWSDFSPAV